MKPETWPTFVTSLVSASRKSCELEKATSLHACEYLERQLYTLRLQVPVKVELGPLELYDWSRFSFQHQSVYIPHTD